MSKIRLADHLDMLNRTANHSQFVEGVDHSRRFGTRQVVIPWVEAIIAQAIDAKVSDDLASYHLGRLHGLGYFGEEMNTWNSTRPTTTPAT